MATVKETENEEHGGRTENPVKRKMPTKNKQLWSTETKDSLSSVD